jgi:hypothetical protein
VNAWTRGLPALILVGVCIIASYSSDAVTLVGNIGDDRCGSKSSGPQHAVCARKCVSKGEKYALVLDDGRVLVLMPGRIGTMEDLYSKIESALNSDAARLRVKGRFPMGDQNTFLVDTIQPVNARAKP